MSLRQMTKVHSRAMAERLAQSGWTLVREFRQTKDAEPYEFYFEWIRDGNPPQIQDVCISQVLPEHAVVRTLVPLNATLLGKPGADSIAIPVGAIGTIVIVHPGAYEVEFAVGSEFALATARPIEIELTH
jgi:hypothetical protein